MAPESSWLEFRCWSLTLWALPISQPLTCHAQEVCCSATNGLASRSSRRPYLSLGTELIWMDVLTVLTAADRSWYHLGSTARRFTLPARSYIRTLFLFDSRHAHRPTHLPSLLLFSSHDSRHRLPPLLSPLALTVDSKRSRRRGAVGRAAAYHPPAEANLPLIATSLKPDRDLKA